VEGRVLGGGTPVTNGMLRVDGSSVIVHVLLPWMCLCLFTNAAARAQHRWRLWLLPPQSKHCHVPNSMVPPGRSVSVLNLCACSRILHDHAKIKGFKKPPRSTLPNSNYEHPIVFANTSHFRRRWIPHAQSYRRFQLARPDSDAQPSPTVSCHAGT